MPRPEGRPSKLTTAVKRKILKAIRDGNYLEPACIAAGVAYGTFRQWMVKGEAAQTGEYREFYEEVLVAEAQAELKIAADWRAQCPENWQACRDFLARRHPERWGPKDVHELHGKDGGALPITIVEVMRTPPEAGAEEADKEEKPTPEKADDAPPAGGIEVDL